MSEKVIFWFRRDLRLADNAGLYAALKSGYPVIPLFIFDSHILSQLEVRKDKRVDFIFQALQFIDLELRQQGSKLCIQYGDPAKVIHKIIAEQPIKAVYTNRDYEPYAIKRESAITTLLLQKGINFYTFKDQVILEPGEVLKSDGNPYTVFTPFAKSWKKNLSEQLLIPYPSEDISNYASNAISGTVTDLPDIGFALTGIQYTPPTINEQLITNYHSTRNIPSLNGTTGLGVHIRFGTISIRKLAQTANTLNETWLNELIWREFYMTILYYFPRVVMQSFKPAYDLIEWRNNEEEFNRWCSGTTGYPIVDAGMRELSTTGFMHNRVRMIAASFLTKHLLIDWRWGEAWFAHLLLDYDLSANNGNWQWASGSGCDAAPYFRIFNPYEQTRKFDPELNYIRKWIPELETNHYPAPIVEHSFARNRALNTYKQGLDQTKNNL